MVDDYCSEAGISVDEYFRRVEAEAPISLTHIKFRKKFNEKFSEMYLLENDSYSPTYREELEAAYEVYKEELVKARADEIVYYQ